MSAVRLIAGPLNGHLVEVGDRRTLDVALPPLQRLLPEADRLPQRSGQYRRLSPRAREMTYAGEVR